MSGYGFLFKGRRLWYTMAVAIIVIVAMRYALGWFSEAATAIVYQRRLPLKRKP